MRTWRCSGDSITYPAELREGGQTNCSNALTWSMLPGVPVLATYHIRPLNQAFKSTFTCLSQLADSPEEEYNRNAFICSSSKGVTYILHEILLFIKRLTRLCLRPLHHRFRDWTKPNTATSLLVGTLTDLARRQSELVAVHAILRQQLIILRRHGNRPVFTKSARVLIPPLTRAA